MLFQAKCLFHSSFEHHTLTKTPLKFMITQFYMQQDARRHRHIIALPTVWKKVFQKNYHFICLNSAEIFTFCLNFQNFHFFQKNPPNFRQKLFAFCAKFASIYLVTKIFKLKIVQSCNYWQANIKKADICECMAFHPYWVMVENNEHFVGEFTFDHATFGTVLEQAQILKFDGVVQFCQDFLNQPLRCSNCVQILLCSKSARQQQVYENSFQFLSVSFRLVSGFPFTPNLSFTFKVNCLKLIVS